MNREELIEKLAASKPFAGVSLQVIMALVYDQVGQVEEYTSGMNIVREGDMWESIKVVISGGITVKRLFQDGTESQIHYLKPGSVIGMEFMRKPKYGSEFFYVAKGDTIIYNLNRKVFADDQYFGREALSQMQVNLISILSHENMRQHKRLDILSNGNLRRRLLVYLFYEQQKHGVHVFRINYTREQLAQYLCVNRSALSREISNMVKDGLIRTKGKEFELLPACFEQMPQ